ncbi:SGNH/GDSL hydrolase family protein [Pseudonocardia benzenivorans]|uniref:SGNH/GDSL hydrolase family protein n=1 Tax=Pseudonocardia benzenivorans TaxID=228005 RepID=A0ABW3VPD0_9PSEU|nr:SGNH/GDSL hydrolase family protein [Pseudonocardia dioxanivorans]
MVIGLLVLLVAGVLLPGDHPGEDAASEVRIATSKPVVPLRIMPLGASSTEGVGSPATAGYRLPLYRMLQRAAVAVDYVGSRSSGPPALPDRDNEGHSGWTLADLSPHVDGWVRAAQPDVVLLHAGTNDLGQGTSGEVTARRLDDVLGRILRAAPRAHVVVAGVWAPLPRARAARAQFTALAPLVVAKFRMQGYSVDFLDTSTLLPPDRLADGLHPNTQGYVRIAALFETEIRDWLATRAPADRR